MADGITARPGEIVITFTDERDVSWLLNCLPASDGFCDDLAKAILEAWPEADDD